MKQLWHREFFEKLENFFEWPGDGPLTKKNSEHNYLPFLKMVPGTFWDWVQKQETYLGFQRIW